MSNALKEQIGGNHYKINGIQPIEFVTANNLGFCEANIVKYTTRYMHKNGIQDLQKVEHYIQLHLETLNLEHWLLRQLRVWFADTIVFGIYPDEYFEANGITSKHQRHLIEGACRWRSPKAAGIFDENTMLNAVRALIAEEMVREQQT